MDVRKYLFSQRKGRILYVDSRYADSFIVHSHLSCCLDGNLVKKLTVACLLARRTANVRSVGYAELLVLLRSDVLNALKDYPTAEASIETHHTI